jgi:hypothetical protein
MLPVSAGQRIPSVTFTVDVDAPTVLRLELRTSDRPSNHTPDITLATAECELLPGTSQQVSFAAPDMQFDEARYIFVCLMRNPAIHVHTSEVRVTGLLAVSNAQNPAVSNFGAQQPTEDIGVDSFEFWVPMRRPQGQNLVFELDHPLANFGVEQIRSGWSRPTFGPNAWVSALHDRTPWVDARWSHPETIRSVHLKFDTDFDHPMESVLMGHPERVVPYCVKHFRIRDGSGRILAERTDNHETHHDLLFDPPLTTDCLRVEILAVHGNAPAALFELRAHG